jgi:hypothetical protein
MSVTDMYRRGTSVEEAPMEGEALLYHKDTKKFCRLNATAAFLWQCLEQPRSVEDLVAAVCDEFEGVERDRARHDVQAAVDEMVHFSVVAKT